MQALCCFRGGLPAKVARKSKGSCTIVSPVSVDAFFVGLPARKDRVTTGVSATAPLPGRANSASERRAGRERFAGRSDCVHGRATPW
jgi:hypothetical protein